MVLIRTFRNTDLNDVIELSERTLGENYNPQLYTTVFQLAPEGFIVSYDHNQFLGFALAVQEETELRILMLAVDERRQRKGVGKGMITELVSRFLAKGVKTLTLEVRFGNDIAIEFYRKMGFSIKGAIPNYYSTGESAYKMTLQIG